MSLPQPLRALGAAKDVLCQPCQLIQIDGSEAHPLQIVFCEVAMAQFVFMLSQTATPTSNTVSFRQACVISVSLPC